MKGNWAPIVFVLAATAAAQESRREGTDPKLLDELRTCRHKIVCESHRDNNFELILMNADGSDPVNLTKTPDIDELYPKASPDGTKIAFLAEEGKGEARRRDLYVMNVDGTGRKKIGENARDPAWSPDGKKIAYLKGEFDKHTVVVFATKRLFIHDLATGETREHANKDLEHLFSLDWSTDGRWFVTTVHGGMGFSHSILAIEAEGTRFFDLKLRGCRPDLAPGGRRVVWGWGDYAIGIADLDLNAAEPVATNHRKAVVSKEPIMTYHMDWSPDARYVVFTRGPKSPKKMLEGATRETPGVQAPGWDLCVCDPNGDNRWIQLTSDGLSYKEPDWVFVGNGAGK
jgi:Tol biopolymer transport system component